MFGVFFLFLSFETAWSYPQFIGYGYSTCLTCHYNGHGGGPINDYGRALWSTDIASKALYPKSMTEEKLGESAGFFGSIQTPYFLKPSLKYRGLWNKTKYGSPASTERILHMQLDANLTMQADPDGKYLATIGWGYWPMGMMMLDQNLNRFLAKEYYVRAQVFETWWIYAGLMERVYGIRNIDHTGVNRQYTHMAERSRSSGAIVYHSMGTAIHKIADAWEATLNVFLGNPYDEEQYKQKGFSAKFERDISEAKRWGVSYLSSESQVLKSNLIGAEFRSRITEGSAVMAEVGLIEDRLKTATKSSIGHYGLVNSYIKMTRGYHLNLGIEKYQQEFSSQSPDLWQWTLGVMAFPAPRLETRFDIINKRFLVPTSSSDDDWSLRGQIHVSL